MVVRASVKGFEGGDDPAYIDDGAVALLELEADSILSVPIEP
jgi:hypothetical protein